MEISEWQWYWPNWWKLWPSYSKGEKVEYFGIPCAGWTFCFGPLQIRGYR